MAIFKTASAKNKLPEKKTMNLYVREKNGNSLSIVIPTALVLAVLIGLFCKFAVIDRIAEMNTAQDLLQERKQELSLLQEQLEDYNGVRENWIRFTENYKSDEEAELVSRMDILKMLEEGVKGYGRMTNIAVVDNEVSVKIRTDTLDDVAEISTKLEQCDFVRSVSVYNADRTEATEKSSAYVTASVLITVGKEVPGK